jgi:hypothetical protein
MEVRIDRIRAASLLVVVVLAFALCGGATCDDKDAGAERPRIADVRAFNELPILWLGESYTLEGEVMQLTSARARCGPDVYAGDILLSPGRCHFTIAYGICEAAPNQSGCRVPLQIHLQPICNRPDSPEAIGQTLRARGVDASVERDGGLSFNTESVRVQVSPPGQTREDVLARAEVVMADLVGANDLARGIDKGEDFAPYVEGVSPEPICWKADLPAIRDGTPEAGG